MRRAGPCFRRKRLRRPPTPLLRMSFELEPGETLDEGVRRVAHEQAAKAGDSLAAAAADRTAANEAIHDARKRFKKIRATLRLVRLEVGEDVFDRENAAWRDAGRLLGDVRESAVIPRTVEGLRERYGEKLAADALDALVERLDRRHDAVLDAVLEPDGPLARATSMADAARRRIDAWPVESQGFDAVRPSLRKVYERGRSRMAAAYDDPSAPRFHDWRKRAKYLWYHLRLLAPTWEEVVEPWVEAQHDLTDLLGEANDLSDLLAHLDEGPLLPDAGRTSDALRGLAHARRDTLREEARPLGRRLYAETPEAFVERMGRYGWAARRAGV